MEELKFFICKGKEEKDSFIRIAARNGILIKSWDKQNNKRWIAKVVLPLTIEKDNSAGRPEEYKQIVKKISLMEEKLDTMTEILHDVHRKCNNLYQVVAGYNTHIQLLPKILTKVSSISSMYENTSLARTKIISEIEVIKEAIQKNDAQHPENTVFVGGKRIPILSSFTKYLP